MKKLISLSLALILIAALVFAVPASAADGLSVKADGKNAKTYNVGDELVYTVWLNAGDKAILDGQVYVTYDPSYLEVVEYAETGKDPEDYSFPENIISTDSLTCNYGGEGIIKFNFSAANAIGVFKNDAFFCQFRFKVKAAGTTDIVTTIEYMIDVDEARIYYGGKAGDGKSPSFKSDTSGVGGATVKALVGDVNIDKNVNNRDAMILDRYVAGWAGYDKNIKSMDLADMNRDKNVNNRDAMILDRYVAGWEGYDKYIIEVDIPA